MKRWSQYKIDLLNRRGSRVDIEITHREPEHFGVQVTAGGTTTSHRVHVPTTVLAELGLADVETESIIRETFVFLLEREPASAILSEFSLADVQRYFPEFPRELRLRLGVA